MVKHVSVLGGHAYLDLKRLLRLQWLDQWCNLDRFGTCTVNKKNFFVNLRTTNQLELFSHSRTPLLLAVR